MWPGESVSRVASMGILTFKSQEDIYASVFVNSQKYRQLIQKNIMKAKLALI